MYINIRRGFHYQTCIGLYVTYKAHRNLLVHTKFDTFVIINSIDFLGVKCYPLSLVLTINSMKIPLEHTANFDLKGNLGWNYISPNKDAPLCN